MNTRGLTAIVVVAGGMLVALYLIVSILSGFGNVLGATYKYFLPVAFVAGAVAPRVSMYLLILCMGYIDFFKKLLAVDEYYLYFLDLFFILGIPPVLLVGICCGVAAYVAQGRIPLNRRLVSLFLLTSILVCLSAAVAVAKNGANLITLKAIANTSSYYGLIFALPALFPTWLEVFKLLRFFVFAMIPAAFHGLGHFFFGLMPFEEAYMLSGFSMSLEYLLRGEGVFGPFASQGTLSGTMTVAATLCVLPFLIPKRMMSGVRFPRRWVCFLLLLLFLSAAVLSLKRFPLAVLPFTVVGYFLIRSKVGTLFAYATTITGLVLLVAYSETIAQRLPDWQADIDRMTEHEAGSAQSYLFRVRTFNTRLEDFARLKKAENWAPFGADWYKDSEEASYGLHSMLVKILLRFGWVPLLLIAMAGAPAVIFLHLRLVRRNRTLPQRAFVFLTSLAVSIPLCDALGAGFLTAFPIPALLGMFAGMAVTIGVLPPRAVQEAPARAQPDWSPLRPPLAGRT